MRGSGPAQAGFTVRTHARFFIAKVPGSGSGQGQCLACYGRRHSDGRRFRLSGREACSRRYSAASFEAATDAGGGVALVAHLEGAAAAQALVVAQLLAQRAAGPAALLLRRAGATAALLVDLVPFDLDEGPLAVSEKGRVDLRP